METVLPQYYRKCLVQKGPAAVAPHSSIIYYDTLHVVLTELTISTGDRCDSCCLCTGVLSEDNDQQVSAFSLDVICKS